jgi:hypothetical protein
MAIVTPCNNLFVGNCGVVAVVFASNLCCLKFSVVAAAQELEKNKKVKDVKRSGMYMQIVQRPLAVTRAVMKFKYSLFCFPSKGLLHGNRSIASRNRCGLGFKQLLQKEEFRVLCR